MRAEQREAAHAVEHDARDAEFVGGVGRPRETLVGDDAAGRGVVVGQILLQRLLQLVESGVEFPDEGGRGDGVEILAARGQADFLAGEWDFDEVNVQAGGAGAVDGSGEARCVVRRGDDAGPHAVLG